MKKLSLVLIALGMATAATAAVTFTAPITSKDRQLLQKHAIQDAEVTARLAQSDRAVPANDINFLSDRALQDGCIDSCVLNCQGGAGSQACWSKCTTEGYSSQVCAGRCGITTALGSQACWTKCGTEGYSSSVCAPRCGVATGLGSQACWNRCTNEGYSSSVCAPRCGTNTSEGTRACWSKCSNEGYSSEVCKSRCGVL